MQDAEYMREYRDRNPRYRDENNRRTRARNRAYRKLAALYPTAYADLYAAALKEERGTR